jgi:hypothetical protein
MPPSPIDFDNSDPLHIEFISSSATLLALTYGIIVHAEQNTPSFIADVLSSVVIEKFRYILN